VMERGLGLLEVVERGKADVGGERV
jgi:hypothetical protein